MVVSHVIGGLGNQMFQYAAGRAVSLERNQPLLLDISGFAGYGLHQGFELQHVFNCNAEIAIEGDLRRILGWQFSGSIMRVLSRPTMAMFRREGFVVEPRFNYWPGIKRAPQDSYLVGYWQSEKYFEDVESIIRADFTFKFPLSNKNAELAEHIGQVNSVSLHVRRGDYAKDLKTTATHGLCSPDYYRAAIQLVSDRIVQPFFFIFSDDISWAKENIKTNFPCRFVDHNQGAESYNDMHLMSLCQHHIIANSSFSWWGAWLNSRPEKIVVAPQKWFANNNDISDLFPESWVSL